MMPARGSAEPLSGTLPSAPSVLFRFAFRRGGNAPFTCPARAKAGRRDQREVSPAGSVRVRFWKPTGLPFIAEPVRFANRPGQRSQSQPKGGHKRVLGVAQPVGIREANGFGNASRFGGSSEPNPQPRT